jgi:hypothetical protein
MIAIASLELERHVKKASDGFQTQLNRDSNLSCVRSKDIPHRASRDDHFELCPVRRGTILYPRGEKEFVLPGTKLSPNICPVCLL